MSGKESAPDSSSNSLSVKKAPLAQPETSESSDDTTSIESNEQKTDSTTISPGHDTSSPAEPSSEADSGLSGSNLAKDESPSGSSALGQLTESTGDSAKSREESPQESQQERGADTENGASTSQNPSPTEETRAAEIERLIARGRAGNPVVETRPLRLDARNTPPYYVPQPLLYTGELGCWMSFLQCWQAYSIYVSDSIFLLPFQVLLLALSISAIVMGSLHLHNCTMGDSKEIPIMIIVLGCGGFLAVILRVVYVVYFYCSHMLKLLGFQRACITMVNLAFVMFYALEMWTFFTFTVSFDVNDRNYCHPVFHTYATILNCGLFLVIFLMFLLHFPAFLFNHFYIGGPGFPMEESQ